MRRIVSVFVLAVVAALLSVAAPPQASAGAVIQGQLIDFTTDDPVPGTTVRLHVNDGGTPGAVVDTVTTNATGNFTLSPTSDGNYWVEVVRNARVQGGYVADYPGGQPSFVQYEFFADATLVASGTNLGRTLDAPSFISGFVVNAANGNRLSGIAVSIRDVRRLGRLVAGDTTNSNGFFKIALFGEEFGLRVLGRVARLRDRLGRVRPRRRSDLGRGLLLRSRSRREDQARPALTCSGVTAAHLLGPSIPLGYGAAPAARRFSHTRRGSPCPTSRSSSPRRRARGPGDDHALRRSGHQGLGALQGPAGDRGGPGRGGPQGPLVRAGRRRRGRGRRDRQQRRTRHPAPLLRPRAGPGGAGPLPGRQARHRPADQGRLLLRLRRRGAVPPGGPREARDPDAQDHQGQPAVLPPGDQRRRRAGRARRGALQARADRPQGRFRQAQPPMSPPSTAPTPRSAPASSPSTTTSTATARSPGRTSAAARTCPPRSGSRRSS